MGDILSIIKSRKTCYEFGNKSISKSSLNKILEAGRWAPSCANIQPWHFVVIEDEKNIQKFMSSASYGAFYTLPKVLVLLVLRNDLCAGDHRCVLDEKVGVTEGHISIGMAGYSMALEAESLGISSAILTPKQEIVREYLKNRKNVSVPLMLAFGYEKKGDVYQKDRCRKPFEEIVFYEKY